MVLGHCIAGIIFKAEVAAAEWTFIAISRDGAVLEADDECCSAVRQPRGPFSLGSLHDVLRDRWKTMWKIPWPDKGGHNGRAIVWDWVPFPGFDAIWWPSWTVVYVVAFKHVSCILEFHGNEPSVFVWFPPDRQCLRVAGF